MLIFLQKIDNTLNWLCRKITNQFLFESWTAYIVLIKICLNGRKLIQSEWSESDYGILTHLSIPGRPLLASTLILFITPLYNTTTSSHKCLYSLDTFCVRTQLLWSSYRYERNATVSQCYPRLNNKSIHERFKYGDPSSITTVEDWLLGNIRVCRVAYVILTLTMTNL